MAERSRRSPAAPTAAAAAAAAVAPAVTTRAPVAGPPPFAPPPPPRPPPPPAGTGDSTGHRAGASDGESESGMVRLRRRYLERQLSALAAHVAALGGTRRSFDEESRALYDAVAPTYDAAHFQEILDRVDRIVPGHGPLATRIEEYRRRFVIPPDRLYALFAPPLPPSRPPT